MKNGAVLELAGKISTVVFDKTGTLTRGTPTLTDILVFGDFQEEMALRLAAGAEMQSEHLLADALIEAAKEREYVNPGLQSFSSVQGKGVKADLELDGSAYHVCLGNIELIEENGVSGVLEEIIRQAEQWGKEGKTVLYLAVNNEIAALLAIADPLKDEARATIKQLKGMNLDVVMLTGDNEETAVAIAKQAGITRVIAGVLPDQKEKEVVRLQEKGVPVAMVGDGINDAPALARADVGIGMGTGIDVAIESADIVLVKGDLAGVCTAISLSRATMSNIRQNLFWAFGYNVVGIPVAAGLLAIFGGPTLNPMIGGAAMALSSVSVVTNALRLRLYNP